MRHMSRLQKLALAVLVLVLLLGSFVLYFAILYPKINEKEQVASSLENEKKVLSTIEAKLSDAESLGDIEQLLTQLPSQPYLEQLFYIMNEAERKTSSVIQNYNFEDKYDETSDDTGDSEGVKTVDFEMTIFAPSFQQMLHFIDYLENSDRILAINGIEFPVKTGETLTYNLQISAFYMNGLDKLEEKQPMIDIPEPSKKTNPLR